MPSSCRRSSAERGVVPLARLTALGLADANVIFSAPPGSRSTRSFANRNYARTTPTPPDPDTHHQPPARSTSHSRPHRPPYAPPPAVPTPPPPAVPPHRPPAVPPHRWPAVPPHRPAAPAAPRPTGRRMAGSLGGRHLQSPGVAGTGELGKCSGYAAAPGKQCGGISVTGGTSRTARRYGYWFVTVGGGLTSGNRAAEYYSLVNWAVTSGQRPLGHGACRAGRMPSSSEISL